MTELQLYNGDMRKNTSAFPKCRKKLPFLQHTIIFVFTISWLIPIAVFSYFIFHTYQNAYVTKSDNLIRNAVNVSGVLVTTDIDEAITKMQKPTYEGDWESMYNSYESGQLSRSAFLTSIRASLMYRFYMDRQVSRYAFYMDGDDVPCCYSGKNGYQYANYVHYVQPQVSQIMKEDSNYVQVRIIDNQIYLIRNLYTVDNYRKYGTLVIGLVRDGLFDELPLEHADDVRICVNAEPEYLTREDIHAAEDSAKENVYQSLLAGKEEELTERGLAGLITDEYAGYAYQYRNDNYSLSLYYLVRERSLYSGISHLNVLVFATLLCMIPIMFMTYRFLRMQLEKPLMELTAAAGRIRDGGFGSTIDTDMPNQEFAALTGSFNTMSLQIKHLFDTVYLEQMATKDAQIAALQAQINPHFLNNTLEMMNWQARMNNDIEVCKMIEALGTVLDSSMNRSNDRQVRLSEELRCGDAFLYIMSMRFGQRLKVVKNIDKKLLHIMVPQLILQPLIENAIRHGIEKVNSGTIWLNIHASGDLMMLDVINTGKKLTREELDRISDIISGKCRLDKAEPGVHTSIGIYNVNKRIGLMYGPQYGLTISQQEETKVLSRITLPLEDMPEERAVSMGRVPAESGVHADDDQA